MFFGEFVFDNSTQIIADLTAQFNATPDGTYGYFYEEWNDEDAKTIQRDER